MGIQDLIRRRATSRRSTLLSDCNSELRVERVKKLTHAIRQIQKLNTHLEFELERLKSRKKKENREFVLPHLPKFLIKYLFLLCIGWQGTVLIIITLIESTSTEWSKIDGITSSDEQMADYLMVLFQAINVVFIVTTSVKLMKQYLHHTASPLFLLQSYLATTLLFAGIYTAMEMMTDPNSSGVRAFEGLKHAGNESTDHLWTADLFGQLCFYSISSATLCGSSDSHPVKWYAYVASSFQILMSFLYFSAIMGHFIQEWKETVNNQKVTYSLGTRAMRQSIGRLTQATDVRRNVYTSSELIATYGGESNVSDFMTSINTSMNQRPPQNYPEGNSQPYKSVTTNPVPIVTPDRSKKRKSFEDSLRSIGESYGVEVVGNGTLNGDINSNIIDLDVDALTQNDGDLDELLQLMQVNLGVMVDLIKQR